MGLTELLLVLAVGGGIVAVLFATFKGAAADAGSGEAAETLAAVVPEESAEFEERRHAVVRALEEIEVDREAGNLSAADYEKMRRRYEREAASILQERSAVGGAAAAADAAKAVAARPASGSRWRVALGWTGGAVGFVAIAWLAMSSALRPRGEDGSITGSIPGGDGGGAQRGGALMAVDMERLAELEGIVAADSNNVGALVELARLYITTQQLNEATRVSLKAIALDPENPGAHTYIGMVLVSIDHVEDGLSSFERALDADADFPDALMFKGMISFQMGNYEAAIGVWEHYLEVAPPEAKLERIRGMLEAARAEVEEQSAP